MNEVPEPEKLARSVQARIMADRNLGHSKSRPFELLGHFDTNDAAPRFERYGFENVSSEKPEVAVDVANG
jgi:hypothetical protein